MPSCQDIWPHLPCHHTCSELPHHFPWAGPQTLASHPDGLHAYAVPASFLVRTLMSLGVAWRLWLGAGRPGRREDCL